jgi:hypothetical protein
MMMARVSLAAGIFFFFITFVFFFFSFLQRLGNGTWVTPRATCPTSAALTLGSAFLILGTWGVPTEPTGSSGEEEGLWWS